MLRCRAIVLWLKGFSPFASLQAHHVKHQAAFVRFNPPSAYLELNSVSLQPLLGSLFNNSLFAQQIDSRYGLPKQLRDLLLNAPVLVRLEAGLSRLRFKPG